MRKRQYIPIYYNHKKRSYYFKYKGLIYRLHDFISEGTMIYNNMDHIVGRNATGMTVLMHTTKEADQLIVLPTTEETI